MEKLRTRCGNWETGELTLSGMPKDFVLSAREVVVLEIDEFEQVGKLQDEQRVLKAANQILQAEIKNLRKQAIDLMLALEDVVEHWDDKNWPDDMGWSKSDIQRIINIFEQAQKGHTND